jgi:competence protein ComEC
MGDLRAPVLGAVAWLAALGALHAPGWLLLVPVCLCLGAIARRHVRGEAVLTHVGWLVTGVGVAGVTLLRTTAVHDSPVTLLAEQQAEVSVRLVTTSDPVLREGQFGDYVVLHARAEVVVGRAVRHRVRAPLLVIGDGRWRDVSLGTTVQVHGRLQPARTHDLSGVLSPRGPPAIVDAPGMVLRGADALRASIRRSAAGHGPGPSALVPGLVDGDDGGVPNDLTQAFRTTGLTHLLAVSGTNLTLVVGSLLLLARWAGVRARGLVVVGVIGVAGFVLLARAEPSVLRAAVMGSVALVGMGTNGRARGSRALGAAVLLLLLLDPWLAQSPGFALSALATAGILWLAPGWRDRMSRWLPRWVAEAVSVPLAAQIACTPLVAGLSGQVSLVAVAANLAAAPVVGPATVLGLAGGAIGLVSTWLGRMVATPAAWCAAWLVAVAVHGAALPVAAVSWSSTPLGLGLLTVVCLLAAVVTGSLLARPVLAVALGLVMVLALLVPLPTPGWPPRGWVLVACDVGQGDGLVLAAGPHRGVVVDTGPDPTLMDRCLRRLGIRQIPLLVLTHFHADHVDGLAGALHGRGVGRIEVTSLEDPPAGVQEVRSLAAAGHIEVRRAAYGETGSYGPLQWQVLGPSHPPSPDSDSPPNDASSVLLVQTHGVRLLLMGDEENSSQEQLWHDTGGALHADVLKVAHHGSAKQDPELVRGVGARLAVISVGVHNDYGHPAPSLLALLRAARMRVARTDQGGDVAVVVDHGLRLVSRR